jgi:hypothetical protein
MTFCAICEVALLEHEAYTCPSCFSPFCPECYEHHFLLGYHESGTWVDDGITRPNTTGHRSYMNDGMGVWIPSQDPIEWGTWLWKK